MKKLLPLFLLLVSYSSYVSAQLTANAANNQTICSNILFYVGGNPTASGGTPPYTYVWEIVNGAVFDSIDNPGIMLATGVYTIKVTVTDGVSASATDSMVVTIEDRPEIWISASDTILPCGVTTVNFFSTVNGGIAPYVYNWSFGDGTADTAVNPTHVFSSVGLYTVLAEVGSSNGCSNGASLQISMDATIVTGTTNPATCFGSNNGSIDLNVFGGSPPYTYLWSNGATTEDLLGISAGTYMVTVTDNMACVGTNTFTVTQPPPITVNILATNESTAGACDGSLTALISGGTPAYTFTWSNSGSNTTLTNLCPGNYSLTIMDSNGCTETTTGVVAAACPNNTINILITSQDLSCTRTTDTMRAIVTGGTPPYYYQWSNFQASPEIIVTQAGVYTVIVTDTLGCQRVASDTISDLGVSIVLQGITNTTCNGINNGSISVNVIGGTAPYTYLWSNGAATDSVVGLAAGTYTLTVTDAALCADTMAWQITNGSSNWSYYVYVSTTAANCGNNGSATVTVNGGTPPFSFLWSNGDTSQATTGLTPGNYTVTVTGSNGCTRTGSKYVNTSCHNVIQGYLFKDTNGNCVKDTGEQPVGSMSVIATNGSNTFYGYANAGTGYFKINCAASGTFNLSFSTSNNGCSNIAVCSIAPITFSGLGDTINTNLGFGSTGGYDLAIHPGWTSANPGFTKQYWVLYNQQGTPSYTGPGVITFTYDTVLQYQSSTQGGVHNTTNHTVTWNLTSVPSSWVTWANRPMAYFTVPANTPIGYQLKQDFRITPTSNDCDTADNHLLSIQPVTGSMDPNEKEVSPAGDIQEEDSVLTYTIHFQNTGNDTTSFVILKDTLSPHLNPASMVNLASSHAYSSFDITDYGILTWVFNPIFLVDSATNESASKGFVMFSIKKKPGLPLNTQIQNKASIYFDYNEPIVTNTVSSKLTNPDNVWSLTNDANIEVSAAPNPFTQSTLITVDGVTAAFGFELYDVNGKLVKNIPVVNESRFVLQRGDIGRGVYFYTITTTNKQKAYGRLVVQ